MAIARQLFSVRTAQLDSVNESASLTFSCSGVCTDKDVAYRMFDQAQMALAQDRKVEVYVDDAKKHNDHCYGNRITVVK